jgi:glycosyltransferase involved in cell wall biosynthesis
MRLTVLNVAYVFAPAGPDTAGGAEQVLSVLDRALVSAGHQSLVIACAGSQTEGTLLATPPLPEKFTQDLRRRAQQLHRHRIEQALQRWPIDVVHCHGHDFAEYLPPAGVPTLVTLHLPVDHYPFAALIEERPGRYFNCVSASQRHSFTGTDAMLPEIPNGVPVAKLQARHAHRGFALALGRICPEKGFHDALEAAALAQIPLLIAGHVFPYEDHVRYFEEEIRPRLGTSARFLGNLDFARKRRFLSAARCLLMPSLIAETSSLVAMEAIACGTPVVAYPVGALPDIIEPGVTGFLVRDSREMAEAMHAVDAIDRERCRAIARRRFSHERMVEDYFAYYRELARMPHFSATPAQSRLRGNDGKPAIEIWSG